MFTLALRSLGSTGNPKLDAIAQASALGIALAGILVKSFKTKPAPKKKAAKVVAPSHARAKVVLTDEAVDELGARR